MKLKSQQEYINDDRSYILMALKLQLKSSMLYASLADT